LARLFFLFCGYGTFESWPCFGVAKRSFQNIQGAQSPKSNRETAADKAIPYMHLSTSFRPKSALIGPNGPKLEKSRFEKVPRKCMTMARMHGPGVAQAGQRAWFTPKGHGMNQSPVIE